MSLSAGARLGPYEIIAPLGAGGMGEVYRATDSRLNRTVAIKILSDESAADADRRERFEREAKAISALDHPNICALYDVGEHQGTYFLVMPCLEGQTLQDRLIKGPLPPDQAIKFAIEIALALDAAHRHGIVHRDLKPGNIMLTKTGVKLLDFGLAKLKKEQGPLGHTTIAKGTGIGTLLGTMPYMSPEQIEGRDVDARSDIFSLGAVIYEMITGQRAFKGDSPASVIGAIMKDQPPPISTVQSVAPPALDHVVTTCLAKDPDERWQSAADIARELRWIHQGGAVASAAARQPSRSRWPGSVAAAIASALIVLAIAWPSLRARPEVDVTRFTIAPPRGTQLTPQRASLGVSQFAISPDGRKLVFVAATGTNEPMLWIRGLNEVTPRELHGTADAADPFWSPDSGRVGFFAGGRLKIIDVGTGELRDICGASRGAPRGGAWAKDDTIIFGGDSGSGFAKVSIATGKVEVATTSTPQAGSHRWPSMLADSRRFLYYARGDRDHRGIYLGSLDGAEPVRIVESMFNGIAANGHLITMREGTLLAYPFDEKAARITGDPIQLADGIAGSSNQRGAFAASATGTLVFGGGAHQMSTLSWFDRSGRETPTPIPPSTMITFRLSPDGRQVAMARVDPGTNTADIWIADLDRAASTRLTLDPSNDLSPVWSIDGRRIVFRSDRSGDNFLYGNAATGTGADEQLTNSNAASPTDITADGRTLLFHQSVAISNTDIGGAPLAMNTPVTYLIKTPYDEYDGRLSPDGRWLAYVSDESGRPEVYVQTYPVTGNKWLVSTSGGAEPRWRRDGRELFYVSIDGKLMAAAVGGDQRFEASAPQMLFQTAVRPSNNPFHVWLDASADGQRFLIKRAAEPSDSSALTVVLNWLALAAATR